MGVSSVFLALATPFIGCRLVFRPAGSRHSVRRLGESSSAPSDRRFDLSDALARADTAWQMLDAQADVEAGEDRSSLEDMAAALLVESALDRMRPWVHPADRYDQVEPAGALDALKALLKEDSKYILDFLSEDAQMTSVHEAFWQGELYLQRLTEKPEDVKRPTAQKDTTDLYTGAPEEMSPDPAGVEAEVPNVNTPDEDANNNKPDEDELLVPAVRDRMTEMNAEVQTRAPAVSDDLDNSVLLARQNFLSTVRFGYFLRRCQQRLRLERMLRGSEARSLEQLLAEVPADDAVELARIATREASTAVEYRATCVFGDFLELFDPQNMKQLELTANDAYCLTIEAAAFGAAVYEAEEAAASKYKFNYLNYGSRNQMP